MIARSRGWSSRRSFASYKPEKKSHRMKLREDKYDAMSRSIVGKLRKIDTEFDIFRDVYKVLDLGYSPGNWITYSKDRLSQIHNLNDTNFSKKCHILGFDLLNTTPPPAVSTIQGNIYSKLLHKSVLNHFIEIGLRKFEQSDEFDSYFVKEMLEVENDKNVEKLVDSGSDDVTLSMGKLTLSDKGSSNLMRNLSFKENKAKNEKILVSLSEGELSYLSEDQQDQFHRNKLQILGDISYKPELVLSDLSLQLPQMNGYFNSTFTRPFTRFNSLKSLNKPITDATAASFDLNDAALMLTCSVLKPGGTFVTRLASVPRNTPEIELFRSKLKKVFNKVNLVLGSDGDITEEVFFIAREKKDDEEYKVNELF